MNIYSLTLDITPQFQKFELKLFISFLFNGAEYEPFESYK